MLLERDALLAELDSALVGAARGDGQLVLLAGEAGVGKTALVTAFTSRHRDRAQVWWGSCDALLTPSPLEPLHDIARRAGGEFAEMLAGERPRHEVFGAFRDALVSPQRPVVVVVEDVHWADGATLDLLVYLARRVRDTHSVVVVTYRDDELTDEHPLRTVLGRLATASRVRRLAVPCLSEQATARLAQGHPVPPQRLFALTGGNPFFLTELLAAPPGTVPETVRDAVLVQVARLGPGGRSALEAVSVVPDRAELGLVAAIAGPVGRVGVAECERAGMLRVDGREVCFRHDLARQAVAESIPAARLPDLHAAVFDYLSAQPDPNPARLAYHAQRALDEAAVLACAPRAAAQAARLGAHREAAGHYQVAVGYAAALPAPERAELLEAYAEECAPTGRIAAGIDALAQAASIWHELGDVDAHARATVRRCQYLIVSGQGREAGELADKAMALVEQRPASPALAAAFANAAYLCMLRDDAVRALAWGERAVRLAEQFDDHRMLSVALLAVGSVRWRDDPEQAEATLVRAVVAARECGRVATVGSALGEFGVGALVARQYRIADQRLAEAIDWAVRHDLDASHDYFRAALALSSFEQGRWGEASTVAHELIGSPHGLGQARLTALGVAGRLAVRRGDADQTTALAEVQQAGTSSGGLWLLWPAAAGRAEAAWYAGRASESAELVERALQVAIDAGDPWAIGELSFWLWRAGSLAAPPDDAAEPYALQMRGEPAAAARAWEAIGCPFEAAVARADGDDPAELRAALETFYRLGARPAANRLVHRMRKLGITGLPRRPHRSTGANPAGLTDREMEVAALLARGLSNADIAARLHISPRTAGHHVAAIMSKLGVSSRQQVAEAVPAVVALPPTGAAAV